MRTLLLAWLLSGMGVLGPTRSQATGQPAPASPDVARLGPQVGERVPEFTLPDQNGRLWTLASLMGPKGLMLVFNRSADW